MVSDWSNLAEKSVWNTYQLIGNDQNSSAHVHLPFTDFPFVYLQIFKRIDILKDLFSCTLFYIKHNTYLIWYGVQNKN